MNIDEHPQIAGQLGIQSIPAVIAFQKGQPVDGFVGALPESPDQAVPGAAGRPARRPDQGAARGGGGRAGRGRRRDGRQPSMPRSSTPTRATRRRWPGLAKLHLEAGDIEEAKAVLSCATGSAAQDPAVAAVRAAIELAEQSADRRRRRRSPAQGRGRSRGPSGRFDLALALNAKEQARRGRDANSLKSSGRTALGTRTARASSCCSSSRPGARWTRPRSAAGASCRGCCSGSPEQGLAMSINKPYRGAGRPARDHSRLSAERGLAAAARAIAA